MAPTKAFKEQTRPGVRNPRMPKCLKCTRGRCYIHSPNATRPTLREPRPSTSVEPCVEPQLPVAGIENDDYMVRLYQSFLDSKAEEGLPIDSNESDDEDSDNPYLDTKGVVGSDSYIHDFLASENGERDVEMVEEDETDVVAQLEDDNVSSNLADPFNRHLTFNLHESLLKSVQTAPMTVDKYEEKWPILGKLQVQIPKCEIVAVPQSPFAITGPEMYAPGGVVPHRRLASKKPEENFIKSQIVGNLKKANSVRSWDRSVEFPLTPLQAEMFSIVNNYQDFYYSECTSENAVEIRFLYCLHALNHVLKTRIKVLHHNARLSKKDDVPEAFRDQGLVRPKVLIVVPFRHSAYKIVQVIIDLLFTEDKGNVINKKRFLDDFTGHEVKMPKKNPKPEDFQKLFSGNISDDFKIGITVTKKSLKLYADFYSSDIIIASPLGLRLTIGAVGELGRNFDFLSSLELLIFDQTEVFLMQNWDHVVHLFNHLHLQPKESHGTDFSRVRTWSLDGRSKYYRQTLIFSSMMTPEINSVFNKRSFNYAGKVRVMNAKGIGTICQVCVQLPHIFRKFPTASFAASPADRFEFFKNNVLPQQQDPLMKQMLVFVPSYFDFVKLRNYFKREDIAVAQICEYTKDGKVAKARDLFFHGEMHFMLYTERFHFYNRIKLKGIRHLLFYQPPVFSRFYYEMCNLMQEQLMNKKFNSLANMTVTVLYSKYDVHQLAGIVGNDRAGKMLQSERNVHMLLTDKSDSSSDLL